jgi:hypothetical protein
MRSGAVVGLWLVALFALTSLSACADHIDASPCAQLSCPAPAAPRCDGDTLVVQVSAACTIAGETGAASCGYADDRVDCAAHGQTCAAGACRPPGDPCVGVTCDARPVARCDAGVLTTYAAGTCAAGTCSYPPTTIDCLAAGKTCDAGAGACVDPCAGDPCTTPPAAACSSDGHAITYAATGTCEVVDGAAQCAYAPTTIDCAASDRACAGGACVDPCGGVTCPPAPATTCDHGVLTTHAAGECRSPGGVPACAYPATTVDCLAQGLACDAVAGACVDPCATNPCTAPPAATCADTRAIAYPAIGTCTVVDGVAQCAYPPIATDCAASDRACAAGACVDPCASTTCPVPLAICTKGVLTTYAPGTCTSPGGVPRCDYAAATADCFAQGKACDAAAAACVDPCTPDPCTAPPVGTCSGTTATTYPAVGTCVVDAGVPHCEYAPTVIECGASDQACSDGACFDPCAGVTCASPPPAACSGDVLTTYPAIGACCSPGGAAACAYPPTTTDCAATGLICAGAACKPALVIDLVRTLGPDAILDVAGATRVLHGRVRAPGLTDRSGVDDPDPHLIAQLGVGAAAGSPDTWAWHDAAPDLLYGPGAPGYVADEDDYIATLVIPDQPGAALGYGFRFSPDAGHTWIYADLGAGSADGWNAPGAITVAAPYISEYVDGSGQADAIEVYNPGTIPVPLAGCAIDVYKNGGTTAELHELGTVAKPAIPPGGVFVLCSTAYGNADKGQCDKGISPPQWDGNDAIALRCGATNLDVLGQIGFDPPAGEWGSGVTSTGRNTLVRKCDVTSGDRNGTDPFDPHAQWQGYGTDTTFLGARNCPLP